MINENMVYNGYEVLVGRRKGTGTFKYVLDKKDAESWAYTTRKMLSGHIKGNLKIFFTKLKLHKCSMKWCKELVPLSEVYCLGCENIIEDSRDIEQEKEYD